MWWLTVCFVQWKVRRTIASSLHRLAEMLGSRVTEVDLLPVFTEMLSDVDEVRTALVQHAAEFVLVCISNNDDDNNINNTSDSNYSAVIMAESLREFIWFTWWIQKWHQAAADLWSQPTSLIHRTAYRQLANRIQHCIYYYDSARKLITHFTIPWRVEG